MKIAIIGAGFCGLATAWHLLNASSTLQVVLFDQGGVGSGASGIAAGLLHPFVGAHAKLNWQGFEAFEETKKLLQIANQALGRPVTAPNEGILRLALSEAQCADFQTCSVQNPHRAKWLSPDNCQKLIPGAVEAPGLWIPDGLSVYTSLYLEGLKCACDQKGLIFENRKIYAMKELKEFDIVIAATGSDSHHLPELSHLPLLFVKGQVLELSWPKDIPPIKYALNSHVYLLMTEKKETCLVGATYERGQNDSNVNLEIAQNEILPKAYALFPPLKQSQVLNCYAGMRAISRYRLPLIEKLSPKEWVITGMGSKGLLYHALFAKDLVNQLPCAL